ncbi:MAG TPA: energy transducer TonB [Vicinamibacterales bacterium]|jgi:protein TonB|nr:energy transducer TonB [Vicinamibacterales bacterium]
MASVFLRIRPIGILIICFGFVFISVPAAVAQPDTQQKAPALYAPRPEYPLEARRQHLTGRGLLILHIDRETGTVTSVEISKSIGYKILDDAAVRALRQWRFKPGKFTKIKVPIGYTMGQSEIPKDLR